MAGLCSGLHPEFRMRPPPFIILSGASAAAPWDSRQGQLPLSSKQQQGNSKYPRYPAPQPPPAPRTINFECDFATATCYPSPPPRALTKSASSSQPHVLINLCLRVCFCIVRRCKLMLVLHGRCLASSGGAYSGWLQPTMPVYLGWLQTTLPGVMCSIYVGFVLALVYLFFNVGNTNKSVFFTSCFGSPGSGNVFPQEIVQVPLLHRLARGK